MLKRIPVSSKQKFDLPALMRSFKQFPNVEFAYLFGSAARGNTTALSDIDVAVYLKKNKKNACQELMNRLPVKDYLLDLVILNEASTLLQYEVVSGGKLIYCGKKSVWHEFVVTAQHKYFDLMPFYRFWRTTLKKQILKGAP